MTNSEARKRKEEANALDFEEVGVLDGTPCDHIEDGYDYTDEGLVYERFAYCPKCGEKL